MALLLSFVAPSATSPVHKPLAPIGFRALEVQCLVHSTRLLLRTLGTEASRSGSGQEGGLKPLVLSWLLPSRRPFGCLDTASGARWHKIYLHLQTAQSGSYIDAPFLSTSSSAQPERYSSQPLISSSCLLELSPISSLAAGSPCPGPLACFLVNRRLFCHRRVRQENNRRQSAYVNKKRLRRK